MDWMKDDGIFIPMLNDTGRNEFYKLALQKFAHGQTVCDVGAGTGFLSVLAVKCGAKHVYAVEQDPTRCEYLSSVVSRLQLWDQIEVISGNFLDHNIKADLYVSETINSQIFGEDMIKLSNHAVGHRGRFIPGGFKIWAEIYENHPVFILDLLESEAFEFDPGIDIDVNFKTLINKDFSNQYNFDNTIYKANCLNRLFTMLPNFQDLKLNMLGATDPITVNLNQPVDENAIQVTVPFDFCQHKDHAMLVLKWQVFADDIALDSNKFWFGNVAKPIRYRFRTSDHITITYDPLIRNWRLKY